jgi:peptidoglycan/LPS O-acetylase OafA/YrhL
MEHSVPLLEGYQLRVEHQSQIKGSHTISGLVLSDPTLDKESTRRHTRWSIFFKCLRLGGGYIVAALPQFLQPGGLRRKKQLTPSSYLDALRGYAAFFILNRHRFDLDKTWLARQPILRIVHSGPGMVDLFFVISGFVLSYRLLISMRNRDTGHMLDSLASSIFRRYLRLYGSAAVAMFISMLCIRLNWIDSIDSGWYHFDRKDTFFQQLYDWLQDLGNFSNPFVALEGFWYEGLFSARYLYPMWTIPIEFRGSMVLFGFCTAVCKLSTKHRMILCWVTIALCYYWQTIYIASFFHGMFIADASLGRHPQRLKSDMQIPQHGNDSKSPPPRQSIAARIGYVAMLLAALFLLGGPLSAESGGTFPWQYLTETFPKWGTGLEAHFWPSIGAFMLVFALESYPSLQKPLTLNFSQYLGDLSFGIYAMHQIVMWTFYKHVVDPLREQYLGDSNWARTPGMFLYWLAVLWAAECFMRIDNRVVRLGKYLQRLLFVKWEE